MIKHYRILVIDDDPGIRETYRQILSTKEPDSLIEKGIELFESDQFQAEKDRYIYTVKLVSRGQDGIDEVRNATDIKQPFSLIFMDMAIAGMNGAETARQIWKIDNKIKIVFATAYSEYTPESIIREIGRDDIFYLRKPFNSDEIRQFARALTDDWRLEREKELLADNLKKTNQELEDLNRSLNYRVKKQTATMVQSEKLISLGILTTGIAQRIIVPVTEIHRNLKILGEIESDVTTKRLVTDSIDNINKIQNIIDDLSTLSNADDTDFQTTDIHQVLDTALNVIDEKQHQQVELIKNYGEIPLIRCIPQKLSQAFVNILLNSLQALSNNGEISIKTELLQSGKRKGDQHVRIIIKDNGCGMSEADLAKIYDPFFSTKPPGEGTGLGMNVTYDIIKQHKGNIEIESELKKGTKVSIFLPVSS